MPSPFPGMDPWLEWAGIAPDLQFTFAVHLSGALNAALPAGYYSTISIRTWWEPENRRPVESHIMGTGAAASGPVTFPRAGDFFECRERYVRIRRIAEPRHKLATTLHVVSAEDKTLGHPARAVFEQQQRRELMNGVNRVEIDWLRAGVPVVALAGGVVGSGGASRPGPGVWVYRRQRLSEVTFHPAPLPEPLPSIPVPVGRGLPDARIDLQAILDQCYTGGAYDRRIDYARPPIPPLTPEQQAWAEGILKAKGVAGA